MQQEERLVPEWALQGLLVSKVSEQRDTFILETEGVRGREAGGRWRQGLAVLEEREETTPDGEREAGL